MFFTTTKSGTIPAASHIRDCSPIVRSEQLPIRQPLCCVRRTKSALSGPGGSPISSVPSISKLTRARPWVALINGPTTGESDTAQLVSAVEVSGCPRQAWPGPPYLVVHNGTDVADRHVRSCLNITWWWLADTCPGRGDDVGGRSTHDSARVDRMEGLLGEELRRCPIAPFAPAPSSFLAHGTYEREDSDEDEGCAGGAVRRKMGSR